MIALWLGPVCTLYSLMFLSSSRLVRVVTWYLATFWLLLPPAVFAAVLMVQWTMKHQPRSAVAQWAQRYERKPPVSGDDYQAAQRRWQHHMQGGRR